MAEKLFLHTHLDNLLVGAETGVWELKSKGAGTPREVEKRWWDTKVGRIGRNGKNNCTIVQYFALEKKPRGGKH